MILISFVMLVFTAYLGLVYHVSTVPVPTVLSPLAPYAGCGMGGIAGALSWVAWYETKRPQWKVLAYACPAAALTTAALLFLHFDSFFYREGAATPLALGALITGIAAGIVSLLALKEAETSLPQVSGCERNAIVLPWVLLPMAAVEELFRAGMYVWLLWMVIVIVAYAIAAFQNHMEDDREEES